MSRLQLLGS